MRYVVRAILILICGSSTTFAALPPKPAGNPENISKWGAYTRRILIRMFPENREFMDNLVIEVWQDPETNAAVYESEFGPALQLRTGLLDVMYSEEEYEVILAHEIGHLFLHHTRVRVYHPLLIEKRQEDADDFAGVVAKKLGIHSCVFAGVVYRLESISPRQERLALRCVADVLSIFH